MNKELLEILLGIDKVFHCKDFPKNCEYVECRNCPLHRKYLAKTYPKTIEVVINE